MLQIPAQITTQLKTHITGQGIPADQQRYYVKWVRYYLDFCHKYHFKQGTDVSLSAFLNTLDQKKQPLHLQKLAEQAVQLLFSCTRSSELQHDFNSKDNKFQVSNISPNTNSDNHQANKALESSPGKLKHIRLGAQISSIYGKQRPTLLTTDDAKSYLTSLAVKRICTLTKCRCSRPSTPAENDSRLAIFF
ncbi:MAG: hypothetical protein KQH63_10065 [Desulfobulbaceae bacterium]|nr:hypothetical protein [Desulfobulbaceae bacterium]